MRAVRLKLGEPIMPFGDLAAELPVLGRPLREVQDEALRRAGLEPGDPPEEGPYLVLGDHTWVTAPLLRRFLAACPPGGGQLVLTGPFVELTRALQELEGVSPRYPLAVLPGGSPDPARLAALPEVLVGLDERAHPSEFTHPVLAQAAGGELVVSDAMIHTITHWSHLMRVSLMAIAARAEGARRTFEAMPWWRKGWEALKLLARVRSINPYRLAGGLSERGRRCRVHPTAVVEASILGDDVEIGPFAVVRASVIGDGAKIGEHCRVNVSSVGARAQLSRGATLNLSVMMDEAFISQGNGFQGCVFGRQAFVAWGATAFDLTFGRDIQVWHKGLRASSGVRFLGAAFGHRAKVMPHVIIGYGEEIANDGFLVADPEQVARRIPQELSSEPHVVRGGRAVPLR